MQNLKWKDWVNSVWVLWWAMVNYQNYAFIVSRWLTINIGLIESSIHPLKTQGVLRERELMNHKQSNQTMRRRIEVKRGRCRDVMSGAWSRMRMTQLRKVKAWSMGS